MVEINNTTSDLKRFGWAEDCYIMQLLASEKGIILTCEEYLSLRIKDREERDKKHIKNFVKNLLDMEKEALDNDEHIIQLNKKKEVILENPYQTEILEEK